MLHANDHIELEVELPSRQEPGHVHAPGTGGVVVEHLGDDAYLVEFRVPDPRLEGDAWYEVFEAREHELKRKV